MKTNKPAVKKAVPIILAVLLLAAQAACGSKSGADNPVRSYNGPSGTWAVYWYICGADLESNPNSSIGYATLDIQEMLNVTLPDNVKVVIETGGATNWKNEVVKADEIGRYLYTGDSLFRLASQPQASMGDPATLSDFLRFCNAEYPAENQVLILWDHGGGSLRGVEFDENFGNDSLTLPELKSVMESVPASSGYYEIVGLDACLMASVDMVGVLSGHARYMIASQEVEPGIGWNYEGLFTALADGTADDGASLARVVCDTFYSDCVKYRQSPEEATLSVTDLFRAQGLLKAYDTAGQEALMGAVKDQESYISRLERAAQETKKFGGTRNFEMVDLGELAGKASDLIPSSSSELKKAINECVIYKVNGSYHESASGLSCYYNLSGSRESARLFAEIGTCAPFAYFYDYAMTGVLSAEAQTFVSSLSGPAVIQPLTASGDLGLDAFPVSVASDGHWHLELGAQNAGNVASVYTSLYWVSPMSGLMAMYGTSQDLQSDYVNGVFIEDFTDMWAAIDNTPVFMRPVGVQGTRTLYTVPVMLNGEEYSLHVGYESRTGEYTILGAWKDSPDDQAASKNVRQLEPGDVIEPIQYLLPLYEDGHRTVEAMPLGEAVITPDTVFHKRTMGNGYFALVFTITDYAGNTHDSAQCSFRVKEGVIERLPGGIVPLTDAQPAGSLKAMFISREEFSPDGWGEKYTFYTATLESDDYVTLGRSVGIASPQAGDRTSNAGYTIQIYSDTIDLSRYAGYQLAYISGDAFMADTIYHRRDIVFRVKEIVPVW